MNPVDSHIFGCENGYYILTLTVIEPKRDTAIGTQFPWPGYKLRGQTIPLQQRFRAKGMMGGKKTDQAVHVLTPFAAHEAISRRAANAASTSAGVLNHPKLNRTVPVGKVSTV